MSNESLGYILIGFSMLLGGFCYGNKYLFSGKPFHGILCVALIFGALLVACLAPVGGAA